MKKEYYEAYEDRYKDAYDNKILYHSGASFKDLGKKCFAITKIVEDISETSCYVYRFR